MASILDDEQTIEAQALSTSLDPHGQLIKMLMPRALCIAIYDRMAMPLWRSEGCDSHELVQLVDEFLGAVRNDELGRDERDGFARAWEGDTAYIFALRDGPTLLGALAVSCQDGSNGSRPFSLLQGLLRPALQVLSRELSHRYNVGDVHEDLALSHDPVTGLLTRPAFEQRALGTLSAAPASAQHWVTYADVDRMHIINETQGMHVGDAVIGRIAALVGAAATGAITAARLSGDRFALFFPEHDFAAVQARVSSLRNEISKTELAHDGTRLALSMSFGIASVPHTSYPLAHALAAAEVACKAAKKAGRARIEAYRPCARNPTRHSDDNMILAHLRAAIAGDRFRMEAQPIVDLGRPGPVRRFELLLRMIDAAGESIAPDKFLAAAERHQLLPEVDRWVVRYALEILSCAAPVLHGLGVRFAINISGAALLDSTFAEFLEHKLLEYDLPPQLLSFEIAETAALADVVRAEQLIRQLRDRGHAIALDDFGRGLSSLANLDSLPVSELKIDGALVRSLIDGARAQTLVRAIVQVAQARKLTSTAKCVESEAIRTTVGQAGIDYGQGFAIGRPRSLELVLQELLKGVPGGLRSSGSAGTARAAG